MARGIRTATDLDRRDRYPQDSYAGARDRHLPLLTGAALLVDLTGQQFGRLTVTGLAPIQSKDRPRTWVCRCDCGCGREAPIRGDNLKRRNLTALCGFLPGRRYVAPVVATAVVPVLVPVQTPVAKKPIRRAGHVFRTRIAIEPSRERVYCDRVRSQFDDDLMTRLSA